MIGQDFSSIGRSNTYGQKNDAVFPHLPGSDQINLIFFKILLLNSPYDGFRLLEQKTNCGGLKNAFR